MQSNQTSSRQGSARRSNMPKATPSSPTPIGTGTKPVSAPSKIVPILQSTQVKPPVKEMASPAKPASSSLLSGALGRLNGNMFGKPTANPANVPPVVKAKAKSPSAMSTTTLPPVVKKTQPKAPVAKAPAEKKESTSLWSRWAKSTKSNKKTGAPVARPTNVSIPPIRSANQVKASSPIAAKTPPVIKSSNLILSKQPSPLSGNMKPTPSKQVSSRSPRSSATPTADVKKSNQSLARGLSNSASRLFNGLKPGKKPAAPSQPEIVRAPTIKSPGKPANQTQQKSSRAYHASFIPAKGQQKPVYGQQASSKPVGSGTVGRTSFEEKKTSSRTNNTPASNPYGGVHIPQSSRRATSPPTQTPATSGVYSVK